MDKEEQAGCMMAEDAQWQGVPDLRPFGQGTEFRLHHKLGAHCGYREGVSGCHFSVWAPNAQSVAVAGEFNGWDSQANLLEPVQDSGVWNVFVPQVGAGAAYQFHLVSWHQGYRAVKADPLAFRQGPGLPACSYVWNLDYEWGDQQWMGGRAGRQSVNSPMAIYEVHLPSWRRVPEEGNRPLTYRELAPRLASYVTEHGFTHVEFMPVMEHSSEQQTESLVAAYFAPDGRCGGPQDLMFLVDYLHQRHIGVILDWVAAYFSPGNAGLAYFDGTHLYEHGSWPIEIGERQKACPFDYGRPQVRSFLLSSAFFWLEQYHADGLRLGSVANMLYLDHGRRPGEWLPNANGGRENVDGLAFIRQLNTEIHREFPGVLTFAEETSAWPMASQSAGGGGLGFTFKWDCTFIEDVLTYLAHDPFFRKFHHQDLTRRSTYAAAEAFVLPLSHSLAESGQASLLARMPGDEWQRAANLRLLLGLLYLQPGKKLLFMGDEFAQWQSWNPSTSLDWHLCSAPPHQRMQRWVGDLNHLYRSEPALHLGEDTACGFEWVEAEEAELSILSWVRRDPDFRSVLLTVCNFTPVVRRKYRVGVRRSGRWREVLNSDAGIYGGSGQGNFGGTTTSPFTTHDFAHTLTLTLPPLAALVFKHEESFS